MLVETCLFCGNARWNLELSAGKGVYHCWACRSGGRLDGLLFTLTGARHAITVNVGARTERAALAVSPREFKALPLASVPSAVSYLESRRMDVRTADQYGLRVCVDPSHQLDGRIVIPALDFWTGALIGWLGRSYTGQRPKYLSTIGQARVTGWRWPSRRAPVVIVEGHMDGIAVHRAGASAAVLSGLDTPGILEWAARVSPSAPIVLMLDGEARNEALRLYWRIEPVRLSAAPTVVAYLEPGQDPASMDEDALRALLEQAIKQCRLYSS